MSKNKLIVKDQEPDNGAEARKTQVKVSKTAETIRGIAGGEKLEYILNKKNLLFILYLFFLIIIYIANTYSASGKLREMERIKFQIKELRYEYVTIKKELIELSRRNKVIESLKEYNIELRESKQPPYKLIINY